MRILIAALTLSFVIFLHPHLADACKCVHPGFKRGVAKADVIFTGKVVDFRRAQTYKRGSYDEFVFEVMRVYKGTATRRTVVYSTITSCGFRTLGVKVGRSYLVYGTLRDGKLKARQCNRSRRLRTAAARSDIKRLGPGHPPAD